MWGFTPMWGKPHQYSIQSGSVDPQNTRKEGYNHLKLKIKLNNINNNLTPKPDKHCCSVSNIQLIGLACVTFSGEYWAVGHWSVSLNGHLCPLPYSLTPSVSNTPVMSHSIAPLQISGGPPNCFCACFQPTKTMSGSIFRSHPKYHPPHHDDEGFHLR